MSDQAADSQYFDNRAEAESYVYNQSLNRPGRWQLRSRSYGFEQEYTRGILEAFRLICQAIGCLKRPTKQLYQYRYCDDCHARLMQDETATSQ